MHTCTADTSHTNKQTMAICQCQHHKIASHFNSKQKSTKIVKSIKEEFLQLRVVSKYHKCEKVLSIASLSVKRAKEKTPVPFDIRAWPKTKFQSLLG